MARAAVGCAGPARPLLLLASLAALGGGPAPALGVRRTQEMAEVEAEAQEALPRRAASRAALLAAAVAAEPAHGFTAPSAQALGARGKARAPSADSVARRDVGSQLGVFHDVGVLPDDWRHNVKKLKKIDAGTYGTVYEGTLRQEQGRQKVAVKRLNPKDAEQAAAVQREIEITKALGDKTGFVTYHKSTHEEEVTPGEDVFMMMEVAEGTLFDMVIAKKHTEVPMSTRVRLFAEIVRAVTEMSRLGLVHRDLKPRNILIIGDSTDANKCSAALCDMGGACSLPGGSWPPNEKSSGSPYYMSPEVANAEAGIDDSQDVWALGILMYQIILGVLPDPLQTLKDAGAVQESIQRDFRIENDSAFIALRQTAPELTALLKKMLERDSKKRISAARALKLIERYAKMHMISLEPPDLETVATELAWDHNAPPTPRWRSALSRRLSKFRGWRNRT